MSDKELDDFSRTMSYSIHCTVRRRSDYQLAVDDERAIEVVGLGRLYDVNYRRGYYPYYELIADYLRDYLPGCDVYYGDDMGVVDLFDDERREELRTLWDKYRHSYGDIEGA